MKLSHTIILIPVALAVATIAIYWQVHEFEFISFDDNLYVTENKQVLKGLTIEGLIWAFHPDKTGEQTYWHPFTWLSHMTDITIFGENPGAHHLMNVAIHILNALLLFFTLHLMTGAIWKSAFVAALFALHPINVDSVAWIAERKNLLSTTFWMLTLLAYIRYSRKPGVPGYLLVILCLFLGLLAKPMLVTLPCALLLLDFWPLGRVRIGQRLPLISPTGSATPSFQNAGVTRLLAEKLPLLTLALFSIAISLFSLQTANNLTSGPFAPSVLLRIENAMVSYAVYLWKLAWPLNLGIYYPYPASVPLWKTASAALLIGVLSGTAVFHARKNPYLAVGWFWFLGALLPVSGLIQGGLWPALADRWAYVPAIGIFIIAAWGLPDLFLNGRRVAKPILSACAIALLFILSILSFHQTGHWQNNRSLYQHAIAVTSGNYVAHNNLGLVYQTEKNLEAAMAEYKKALEINPVYALAFYNLGVVMKSKGSYEEAFQYLARALQLNPNDAKAHDMMGRVLHETGRNEEAIRYFAQAIAIAPDHEKARNNLSAVLTAMGRYDEAIWQAREALRIDPEYADAHFNIGTALVRKQNTEQAAHHFQKAIDLKPGMAQAHISLANIYYGRGDMAKAVVHYQKAIQIEPGSAEAHANLANALRASGRMDEAIDHYLKAVAAAPDLPETHNNLGVAYVFKGEIDKAAACFQKALELRPGYENAANNLRRLDELQP